MGVATVLLTVMFFFDIYWVFISPLLFHESVMIKVAQGGGTQQAVPMLLRIPDFGDPLGGERLLGFGDIALPGLLVSYLLRYDLQHKKKLLHGYFVPSLFGYCAGLTCTMVSLYVMQNGQPALMYLVPSTLGITLLLACCRGDLESLWVGFEDTPGTGGHFRSLPNEA